MKNETQHKLAEKEINNSTFIAAGCGAIPVSYIDIGATMITQMRMMKGLCDIYEVKWDEHFVKSLLGSALGNIGKRMGVSMIKSIPIIGGILGAPISAILSGVSTYTMGHAFMKYMKVNSTIKSVKDIDIKAFTTIYDGMNKQMDSVKEMIRERWSRVKGGVASSDAQKESVVEYGERMFGTKDKFHKWLNRPNQLIGDRKPIELLLSIDEKDQEKVRRLIVLHSESKVKAKA